MKKVQLLVILFFVFGGTFAQSTYMNYDQDIYGLIDRYEIKNGEFADEIHSTVKPYRRSSVVNLVNNLDKEDLSKTDQFNIDYFKIDNWHYDSSDLEQSKKPILKWFYKKKSDFYSVDNKDFKLKVNPVIYFQGGKDNTFTDNLYLNTRGIVVEGLIDEKIGFYTFMADNQMVVPQFVENYAQKYSLPHQGFLKRISGKNNSYDFFTARGYISYNITKHINSQFGHDRHFIGNGIRSLAISDNTPNYLFLKFSTKIWKIKYTNIFAEMNAENRANVAGDKVLEKKYLAFHHLSWNATKNLNFGLWEATPFGRNGRYFELQYLNPIIFYRSVEQQIGSGDNAIIGADVKWNFKKHFSLYSQLVLDELKLGELRAGNGWWGNKQALQLGAKYIDAFGIKNLDLQVERNTVRPFVYSHKDLFRNYSHNGLPLAHPIGANLKENILFVRYQPMPKLDLQARVFMLSYGADGDSTFYGNNINTDYSDHGSEYGHNTLQGTQVDIQKIDLIASYQFKHNMFFDLQITNRNSSSNDAQFSSNATILMGALRWNIHRRIHDF